MTLLAVFVISMIRAGVINIYKKLMRHEDIAELWSSSISFKNYILQIFLANRPRIIFHIPLIF